MIDRRVNTLSRNQVLVLHTEPQLNFALGGQCFKGHLTFFLHQNINLQIKLLDFMFLNTPHRLH